MVGELAGEWTLDKNENYDEFLKAAGVGSMKRSMIVKLGGSLTIKSCGDSKVSVKTVNGPKSRQKEITLNEEFEDEAADGTPAKGKMVFEDNKLTVNVTTAKGKKIKITREIKDGALVQTMDFDGVVCKRIYKKK